MDDDIIEANAVMAHTRLSLAEQLRSRFFFMTPKQLDHIVATAIASLDDALTEVKPAMAASRARFDFFCLPGEIRNRIYELALEPHRDRTVGLGRPFPSLTEDAPFFPPLVKVCRQIRTETLPMLLAGTQINVYIRFRRGHRVPNRPPFSADDHIGFTNGFKRWLKTIGSEQVKNIKSVVVRVYFASPGRVLIDGGNYEIMQDLGFDGLGVSQDAFHVETFFRVGHGRFKWLEMTYD